MLPAEFKLGFIAPKNSRSSLNHCLTKHIMKINNLYKFNNNKNNQIQ